MCLFLWWEEIWEDQEKIYDIYSGPKSALIQPDSISVKGQMHDIGGQKLGPVLADIFYSPLILRYLGEFSVKELQAVEN